MKPLRFHPAAREEYVEALRRCEEEREGRGRKLEAAAEGALERATGFPESGPILAERERGAQVRAFRLHRFPFSILVATIDEEQIVIAFAHQSREPGYWKRRTGA